MVKQVKSITNITITTCPASKTTYPASKITCLCDKTSGIHVSCNVNNNITFSTNKDTLVRGCCLELLKVVHITFWK